jgi:hypothetical protein
MYFNAVLPICNRPMSGIAVLPFIGQERILGLWYTVPDYNVQAFSSVKQGRLPID